MIKKITKIIYVVVCLTLLDYLSVPSPDFPLPPKDAVMSAEPADTETPLRRAYFTNATREEVVDNYKKQFDQMSFFGLKIPSYKLNYGPEEAQTIIRDQARSTFLEEVVHPFRESLYINGFEPKDAKDAVVIAGIPWRQKITVRYVPSNVVLRLAVGAFTLVLAFALMREYSNDKKRN